MGKIGKTQINIYNNNMISTPRLNNVKKLQAQYRTLKGEIKHNVVSLIDLYKRGNIHNINTLRYEINKMLSPSTNQLKKDI